MFRIATLTAILFALTFVSLGCDQQAQDRREAQLALDQALALLKQSNLRYIPGEANEEMPWSEYRQSLLDDAAKQLDDVMAEGVPGQQQIARSLKAQIMLSTARMQSDDAMADYRHIALLAASMTDKLAAVNTLNNRVQTLDFNAQPAVDMLNSEAMGLEQQRLRLTAEARKLETELQSARQAAEELREQAEVANTLADELQQKAFIAAGVKKIDLQEDQAQAQLQAAEAMSKRDAELARAQSLESQLAFAQEQIKLTGEQITALQTASRETADRDQQRKASRDNSRAMTAATSAKLMASVDALLQMFSQQVEEPMSQATTRFSEAASMFDQAIGQTKGRERQTMQAGRLTALIDQAQVLTSHAIALGDMARFLRFLETAGTGLSDEQKNDLAGAYDDMKSRQSEVLSALQDGDQAVTALAQETAGNLPDDQTSERLAVLQKFSDMAAAARLQ